MTNTETLEKVSEMELMVRKKLIEHLNSGNSGSFVEYKKTLSHSSGEKGKVIAGLVFEYSGANIQFELKSKGITKHEYSMAETIIQVYVPISERSELEIIK